MKEDAKSVLVGILGRNRQFLNEFFASQLETITQTGVKRRLNIMALTLFLINVTSFEMSHCPGHLYA